MVSDGYKNPRTWRVELIIAYFLNFTFDIGLLPLDTFSDILPPYLIALPPWRCDLLPYPPATMIFELLVIIVVTLCGYIPWLYWRSKTPIPDMILETERRSCELQAKDSVIKATKGELRVKDTELQVKDTELQAKGTEFQAKDTELQAKDTELQAKDTELQAKDTELQTGCQELQFRDTTIYALVNKVEKGRGSEAVLNILSLHRDLSEAIANFMYECRYDGAMSDLRTLLEEMEEAYLAKCRARDAVTGEYSVVVAFASSKGIIPPPNEPTLARILMEYQKEFMLSDEREEERRRLERASERRRRIINYQVAPR
ncbi:hypothetical protein IWQ61_003740 [Dispira simplex]|nr:hypothetical protein IWQ61_003740 [Dispira simplex]